MALKDIKNKIKATERTHKVTRAMEAVSAVKMRKTQVAAIEGRPYVRAALSILARLSGSSDITRHPIAQVREVKRVALVVITSDKGLAGALNSGVLKAAFDYLDGHQVSVNQVVVYAYGKKGFEYFSRRGYTVAKHMENKKDQVEVSVMEGLAAELTREFIAEKFDEVLVAYSNFKSTFEQAPTVRRLLPLATSTISELVRDIVPTKGKFSDVEISEEPVTYSVEPDGPEVLAELVPRLVSVSLYHMLLESKASEHSARMVAMKNASDKSEEISHDLTRLFNKIRQAGITREVSEIVGGREALAT